MTTPLSAINGEVFLVRLAQDSYWQHPRWTPATWYAAMRQMPRPADPILRTQVDYWLVLTAWRVSFWHQWQQRPTVLHQPPRSVPGLFHPPRRVREAEAWIASHILTKKA